MVKRLAVALLLLTAVGCAKIDYIGQSYPPTADVDVYFAEEDIEVDYKIIGRIFASVEADAAFYSNEKLLEKIKKKAVKNGGHGVVILGFERVPTGTSFTRTETTEHEKGKTVTREHGSEDMKDRRQITALVIRYREQAKMPRAEEPAEEEEAAEDEPPPDDDRR